MLEREGYPAGVPCWVDTSQPDPEAAVRYYSGVFGWEFDDRAPVGSDAPYFVAKVRGRDVAAVAALPQGAGAMPATPAWNTYVWVDSVDTTAAKVTAAGGTILVEPTEVGGAGRSAVFADPDGGVFSAWEAKAHKGAGLVNEPNTWNWSDIYTRDLERAEAFYGAVFGWQAMPVDLGFGESVMWCRPGYAEFLEQFDPGMRSRHAESGVPAGFSDAIGWMLPTAPEQGAENAPPQWRVTFAVDDTDAVAAKSDALGGGVVTAPFDAGVVRMAVLRDPHGAEFTVSRFQP